MGAYALMCQEGLYRLGVTMSYEQNIDFVLRTVEERDIRFVRLWFTDVLGNLKSFAISPEDLEEAFDEGIGFDGAAVDGFAPLQESDMLAFPDPETFQMLPWRPETSGAARIFCDIKTPSRESFAGDPRAVLTRVFMAADKMGYLLNVGPEIEYFYFANDKDPVPMDNAGYFDLTPSDSARDLRRNTTLTLEKMSIPVEYSYHAVAPSQNGIQLRYAEARTSADNIMTARHVIKQAAFEEGMYASFMPKPFNGTSGSGLFLQESLFDHDGNNLFWAEDVEGGTHLSDLAKHYVAGILKYAREISLVTNPTVNSYKRFVPDSEVPCFATWGRKNRSALVRIPTHKPGKHASTRIEIRSPDPTCNPYLAIAATLAAGLKGIEDELELQPESPIDLKTLTPAQLAANGITPLPRDLGEAIEAFEHSELMHETLGEHVFDFLLSQKRHEWEDYRTTISSWELGRYYAGF